VGDDDEAAFGSCGSRDSARSGSGGSGCGAEPGGKIFSDTITPVDYTASTPDNFGGFVIWDIEFDTLVNPRGGQLFRELLGQS
jgi:hypothetical protein